MDDLKSIEDPAPVDVTTLVSRIFIVIPTFITLISVFNCQFIKAGLLWS